MVLISLLGYFLLALQIPDATALIGGKKLRRPVRVNATGPMARLSSGTEANSQQFLYFCQVYINDNDYYSVISNVIRDNLVITACNKLIRFSIDDMNVYCDITSSDSYSSSYSSDVAAMIVHPEYRPLGNNGYPEHDVCLLRLTDHLPMDDTLNVIRLPSLSEKFFASKWGGYYGTVLGFTGNTYDSPDDDVDLLYEKVKISGKRIILQGGLKLLSLEHLMVSVTENRASLCKGDEGTGLVVNESDDIPTLIAIASVTNFCPTETNPNIYTRLAPYVQWIADNGGPAAVDRRDMNANFLESFFG